MSFRERYRKFKQWRHEPQHFEMSDAAAVIATTVIPLLLVAFEVFLVYMIRRFRRKMQKDRSLLHAEHIDTVVS